MAVHMLTTDDNPYDPFTQWNQWYTYDETSGHHTTGLLARIVKTSHHLSDADQDKAIEDAMQEIVDLNASGLHRLVTEDIILG
jgi:hypothetical protein